MASSRPASGERGPPPGEALAFAERRCEPYSKVAEEYGYCLYMSVSEIQDAADAKALCDQAFGWSSRCVHAWVAVRLEDRQRWSDETLLDLCGTNQDCAFETLDFRPADDILVQLRRCEQYASKYEEDCAGHSLQRWWMNGPSAEEVSRVLSNDSPYDEKVGSYAAAAVVCSKVGSCEGLSAKKRSCEVGVADLQAHPERCAGSVKAPGAGARGAPQGPPLRSPLR